MKKFEVTLAITYTEIMQGKNMREVENCMKNKYGYHITNDCEYEFDIFEIRDEVRDDKINIMHKS